MLKRFLLTTAVLSVAAMPVSIAPALAQDSNQPTTTSPAPAPAPAPSATPDASTTAEAPVTPPPSDAIIAAESSDEMRADKLIGMKVYNADGKEVGKVKDVLFDKDGNAKGVVLSVGGVLGIGAKPVGLQWKEIDLQPEQQAVKVNYSKEQLEAAPAFKTQEAQASEMNSANQSGQPSAAPSPSGAAPAPAPSGSDSTE